jgi:hypothetical protein
MAEHSPGGGRRRQPPSGFQQAPWKRHRRSSASSGGALRGALPAEDILYRWHGPTFVAALNRAAAIEPVRAEVRRLFPIVPPLDALQRKVEIFTATQLSHDNI